MFELVNVTGTIINEITVLKLKQSDVAKTYALAIISQEDIDWKKINQEIMNRWSKSGLARVKRMAWKIAIPF